AKVVVNFGGRGDGRARIARGVFLADGDGRGDAGDLVHIGLFHALQELPGVGGEGFDVAALAFGIDGVKGQGDLPEPLTPVTTVRDSWGISTVMFLRLWTRAPRTRRTSCCWRVGAMVSFVAKGKLKQHAYRMLPKPQSIRLRLGCGKLADEGLLDAQSG